MIGIISLKPVDYLLETEKTISAYTFLSRAKSQHYLKVTRDDARRILEQLQADPFCWKTDKFEVQNFRIYILIEAADKSVIWDLYFLNGTWRHQEMIVTKNAYFGRAGRALIIHY